MAEDSDSKNVLERIRWRWVALAAVPVICAYAYWRILSTVEGSGVMEPEVAAEVRLPIDGQVAKLYRREGEQVTSGEKVLRIVNSSLLTQLQAGYAAARRDWNEAATDVTVTERLVKDGVTTEHHLEVSRARAASLRERYDGLRAQLAIVAGRVDPDGIMATSGVADVHATLDGTLFLGNTSEWSSVQPGQPVFKIARMDRMQVVAFVRDRDAYRLKAGQPAMVNGPATDGMKVAGRVKEIGGEATPAAGGSFDRAGQVRIVITLDATPQRLFPGAAVTCSIQVR